MFGRKKEKRVYDDDDGHVIANMNVDGMPWYRKESPEERTRQKNNEFSKDQTRYIILGTLKAALLIAGVFLGAIFLFILLIYVVSWLRYG